MCNSYKYPMCFLWLRSGSSKLKKKENFEFTHLILDGNKIEHPYTKNYTHMQIILPWSYLCLWLSFTFDIKFKSKLDIIFRLVFKFWVIWFNILNDMTIILK